MPFRGMATDWKQVDSRWLRASGSILYHIGNIGLHGVHGIDIGSIGPHLARLELRDVHIRRCTAILYGNLSTLTTVHVSGSDILLSTEIVRALTLHAVAYLAHTDKNHQRKAYSITPRPPLLSIQLQA